MIEKLKYVWMDGELVDWDEAKVHVLCHSFHYGTGAFEGIRAYKQHDGTAAVFRLRDHIRRLFDSAKILGLDNPYTIEEFSDACKETLAANGLHEGYIRPVAYFGEGGMGVYPGHNKSSYLIAVWKWGAYLGDAAIENGIRTCISSFQRFHPNTWMTRAKMTGSYITGTLAKTEAKKRGYDEGIMLDVDGYVAEGTGENLFMVRDGVIKTTPLTVILPGLTRASIIQMARDEGYEVVEEKFTRDELYIADEAFFTGTAAEVTPIREVDDRPVGNGKPGPVTKKIQEIFFNTVRGKETRYAEWLDPYAVPVNA